jgi:hypothetical protein
VKLAELVESVELLEDVIEHPDKTTVKKITPEIILIPFIALNFFYYFSNLQSNYTIARRKAKLKQKNSLRAI